MSFMDIVAWLWEFWSSSMGQMLFWGLMTFAACIYTLVTWLNRDDHSVPQAWRFIAATLMSINWMINIAVWFMDSLKWMLVGDVLFVIIACKLYKQTRYSWALQMRRLFCLGLAVDSLLYMGVNVVYYSIIANVIYGLLLMTVVGMTAWFGNLPWILRLRQTKAFRWVIKILTLCSVTDIVQRMVSFLRSRAKGRTEPYCMTGEHSVRESRDIPTRTRVLTHFGFKRFP